MFDADDECDDGHRCADNPHLKLTHIHTIRSAVSFSATAQKSIVGCIIQLDHLGGTCWSIQAAPQPRLRQNHLSLSANAVGQRTVPSAMRTSGCRSPHCEQVMKREWSFALPFGWRRARRSMTVPMAAICSRFKQKVKAY